MVILFSTKYLLFVDIYIDLSKFKAYKLFENSGADISWLLFQRSQLVSNIHGFQLILKIVSGKSKRVY